MVLSTKNLLRYFILRVFTAHIHKIKPKRHKETFGDHEYVYHFDHNDAHICTYVKTHQIIP